MRRRILCLAAALVLGPAPAAEAELTFAPPTRLPTGNIAESVTIGDLDGDGHADMVVGDNDDVAVFRGAGTGAFGPRVDYPANATTVTQIADLNGDGRLDLASNQLGLGNVRMRFGTGSGSLGAPHGVTIGSAFDVEAADVDADGRVDLVTANGNANNVSVRLGVGGGAFGPVTDYPAGSFAFAVAVGDVNGDARQDLVSANGGAATVSVLLGTGGGAFGAKTDLATHNGPEDVAIGDLNEDGLADLAVANNGSGDVSVLLGTGAGFGPRTDYPVGATVRRLAIADLDGDGHLDLVVPETNLGEVALFPGDGSGTFATKTDLDFGGQPSGLAVGDLNSDGSPDLAVADETGAVVVRLNAPRVDLSPAPPDFGAAETGMLGSARSVTVANGGSAPLRVRGFDVSSADFYVESDDCAAAIAPGAVCTAVVRFAPAGTGAHTATLAPLTNAPGSAPFVALTGTGTGPAAAAGPQGAAGGAGDQGPAGPAGSAGGRGPQGATGPRGATGSRGPAAAIGGSSFRCRLQHHRTGSRRFEKIVCSLVRRRGARATRATLRVERAGTVSLNRRVVVRGRRVTLAAQLPRLRPGRYTVTLELSARDRLRARLDV